MSPRARCCVMLSVLSCLLAAPAAGGGWSELPTGSAPQPVPVRHFPDRLHAFVWRNWSLIDAERLAKVVGAEPAKIRELGRAMGLPPQRTIPRKYGRRFYITVVRRNWHLLPYDQLLELLDVPEAELATRLREDDFLWIKLGRLKPDCAPLCYREPGEDARERQKEIREVVGRHFGDRLAGPAEPRFAFIERLSEPLESTAASDSRGPSRFELRFIYSYFAPYGDPLADPDVSPYPDGLLQRLAAVGARGVWLPGLLRDLAPSEEFPEFGDGHRARLAGLRRLVERAAEYDMRVYLYLNEPRSMPAGFFQDHPDAAGVREGGRVAMCTSNPKVRRWLGESTRHVFQHVPGLGGAFTITASENLTHCASHGGHRKCPRCRDRSAAEIIAGVNNTIEQGMHRAAPDARMIAWDWGWNGHGLAPDHIRRLSDRTWLMSVSEWSLPIERGGVGTAVGEYSISAVGPGPRAKRQWKVAKQSGLKTVAKVQLNNTWELSAVPYLPVPDLVARHCRRLGEADVDGLMMSWTLGGYPSVNLEVAGRLSRSPAPDVDEVLDAAARERYGEGAPTARRAWTAFSDAFQQFPFHIGVLYRGPQNYGPYNLLYLEPTGYSATMLGFPYDDVEGWSGPYPPDVLAAQFRRVADGWAEGVELLERAVAKAPAEKKRAARRALNVARAAGLHFRSSANQARFVIARNALLDGDELPRERHRRLLDTLRRVTRDEIAVAKRLFECARRDSRIGFEASNQYYYVPLDMVEKVINCRRVLERIEDRFPAARRKR